MSRQSGTILAIALALAVLAALPGRAQTDTPESLVRWIYTSLTAPGRAEEKGLAWLTAPPQRRRFLSGRLAGFYDANDSYGDDLMLACVDFAFDIPGNDFDAAEIARNLNVTSTGDATRQDVTASFTNFGQPAQITYTFIPEGGIWKLDDIAGPGWRVSEIPCSPKSAPSPATTGRQIRGTGYCYDTGDGFFVLDVASDGRAVFELQSWQDGGHSCGLKGQAEPMQGGWAFRDDSTGSPCRMEILVTEEGGLRLTDAEWGCKRVYCGQRAVIDGLSYPRQTQVDCATIPLE